MRVITQKLDIFEISYPIERIAPIEKILFFDIETTGFTARNSNIYLIGCVYHDGTNFQLIQWFAENYQEEKKILEVFFEFSMDYSHIIHFNGNNFDIPFVNQKCMQYALPFNFDHLLGIDLYKRVTPLKHFLSLTNCKQKSVEQFLGISRKDTCSGGDLISIYHSYVSTPSEYHLNLMLLHNADDIKGLVRILPILAYYDLFNEPVKAKKVQANTFTDYYGTQHQELIIRASIPVPLPAPIHFHADDIHFQGEERQITLRVPIYNEEMKYFYSNYKDYYYMPDEDMAVHKSVAAMADRSFFTKATAATCYTRKFSSYLPQWDVLIEPFFKRDYSGKELFFELSDEIKTSRDIFSKYARHLLQVLVNTK